ncbi:MAG: 30S ribosomal protein S19e [Nanoarchaeota archaeon]|nr:30S ribosomal protein S19e [Nanoarchaeota archaeon]
MATVFDVNPHELIGKLKEELKKIDQIKMPEWAKFVKTGSTKTKPPEQEDFWYIRAASILRQLYIRGKPMGVQRLRVKYGDKTKNTGKPPHFKKASGKIIRNILQQLEAAGLVEKTEIKGRKGRIITNKGKSLIDKLAAQIKKGA